jgi:ribonuclease D
VDTHYLLPLRQLQASALVKKGRQEEAREVFDQVAGSQPTSRKFDPQDFWRIKGSFDLSTREQSILRELYIWRDQQAERLDRPVFKVLSDRVLVALARARPRSLKKLASVDGLSAYHADRFGKRILRAVDRGKRAPPPSPPAPPPRHSREELGRFEALRNWRKGVAIERGVDPDVIVSNTTLWALAERNPRKMQDLRRIDKMGQWKRQTYGEAILRALDADSRASRAR